MVRTSRTTEKKLLKRFRPIGCTVRPLTRKRRTATAQVMAAATERISPRRGEFCRISNNPAMGVISLGL